MTDAPAALRRSHARLFHEDCPSSRSCGWPASPTWKTMRRLLELFSGTGSMGRAFAELGWEVTSLDVDPKAEPTICADICSWEPLPKFAPRLSLLGLFQGIHPRLQSLATHGGEPRVVQGHQLLIFAAGAAADAGAVKVLGHELLCGTSVQSQEPRTPRTEGGSPSSRRRGLRVKTLLYSVQTKKAQIMSKWPSHDPLPAQGRRDLPWVWQFCTT